MTSVDDQPRNTGAAGVLAGGGEMGALMRAHDWAATPLGPVEDWPQSLKTCVRLMLTSRQPMWLGWGDDLTFLYNDPYRSIVGGKHPEALGQPTAVVWREIWADIAPRIQAALGGDEGTYDEALLLIMERHGYPEETYYTFSYSPIPDDEGRVAGIFCANTDDTQRVIGERQLALLRDLAAGTAEARTIEDACTLSMGGLETDPYDVPFALLYILDPDQRRANLYGMSNIAQEHAAATAVIALDDDEATWPVAEVVRSHAPSLIRDLAASFGAVPAGAWERPPTQAVALPIMHGGQSGPAGILIAGLNPYRLFDDNYQGFLGLVAGQIGTAIANARAYAEERRRAEALAELDRVKTAFFNNVSHEFRTPLTLLLGPLEEALAAPPETPLGAERAQLESAHRNSLRLLRLVNTLLDFARLEAGRVEASFVPIDLAALTAELAGMFRSAVERAGLHLVVDCPPLPDPVYVDRDMWEKIVLNLLSNALKFTFEGEIGVRVYAAGDYVELEVRDSGVGIPAAELPHIFERFHRVQAARARTHEGTGIGLALVRELVTLHGGTVGVESTVGDGTTVTVALPLGTAHVPAERIGAARTLASTALGAAPYVEEALRWLPDAAAGDDTVEAEASGGESVLPDTVAARVLVADDNADMRAYLLRLLGTRYAVEVVTNGAEALAAARAHPPDLVVSDVMMPQMDGVALLQALRADLRTRMLPVILLSARAGEEATAAGLEAGADDYLVKPFVASELMARAQAHVALARLRQAAREEVVAERDRLQAEVAARARVEESLRTSRAHVDLALTAARMVTWEWDPHADVVTTSENLADIYGVARLDASAQGFPLVHPDDRARHEATVRAAVAAAGGYQSTFRISRPDSGEVVWLEERGTAVLDATGALQKLTGVTIDVTARVQAEAELRQQVALLALAHDAIIVRDPRGVIMAWNDGAAALYGWTATEAVGQVTHDLLQARVLPAGGGGAEVDAALAARGAWEGELEHTRRDGTQVVVESRQSLLRGADGTPRAILEVNRDATARRAIARLHRLAAALSAAVTIDEVADVIIAEGLAALGGNVGVVALLSDDGASFTNLRVAGFPPEVVAAWPGFPADGALPIADAVRARAAVILESRDEHDARYPHLADVRAEAGDGALVAIPLQVGDRVVGGLGLSFPQSRQFNAEERAVMGALGELCAQALERARLYEAAQQARAEAEAERQRLGEIFQVAPAMIAVLVGPDHVFEVANDLYRRGSGRGATELIGRSIHEAFPELAGQGFYELLDDVYRTGTPYVGSEIPVRLDRDGDGIPEGVYFTFTYQPLRDAAGAVEGIMVLAVDVTEQVHARLSTEELARQLRDERDRLRQILDTLPVGVAIVDAEGRVEALNLAGQEMVGWDTRGRSIPRTGEEAYDEYGVRRSDGSPYPAEELPLARSLYRGEIVQGDQELLRTAVTGQETSVLVNSAPLRDAAGAIVGAVAIFQDITALRELERAREEFLSSAAHDLKTPLTSIRGQAQLAQRRLARLDSPETATVLSQLVRIQEGADAMVGLINELVDVTRQQMGGGLDLQREPTDLVALVEDSIAAQRDASGRLIAFEASMPELLADVDAARIARVVGNLLSNALKYSPADQPITVQLGQDDAEGPQAVLAVRDEGIGIPAADLPHIFDRFQRARNVTGHIQGTGIGLASARGIVEQHGGTITVESVEGAGATFTVRLPLAAP